MRDYEGVPIRRLPDGPQHLTGKTRWKVRERDNWLEEDKKHRQRKVRGDCRFCRKAFFDKPTYHDNKPRITCPNCKRSMPPSKRKRKKR